MINGKFFTGLPPKMIDRREGSAVKNRQESHFFWPDDSQLESAAEVRVKRRNSLLLEPADRPRVQQQPSLGASEVDTRQRFHKEFAKSSIQFCDNIPEEGGGGGGNVRPERRQHVIRGGKLVRKEITAKPTATKIEMPESCVDVDYTNNRKKQVFESKIQFYDNVDEDRQQRNNVRKPKLDMNDKKDVERNTKNSPKLQVKRSVRNLSEERMNNDIKEQTPERSHDEYVGPQRVMRNSYVEERTTTRGGAPVAGPRTTIVRETRRTNLDYDNEVDIPKYSIGRTGGIRLEDSAHSPKKILKHPLRVDSAHSSYDPHQRDAVDLIEDSMRGLRATASPKKHVTYRDETHLETARPPPPPARNMRTGNDRQRQVQYGSRTDDSALDRNYVDDVNVNVSADAEPYQYMETRYKSTRNRDPNIHNNSNNMRDNTTNTSYHHHSKLNNQAEQISPKPSATDGADAQKHLRSSLGFNNGEIVADNVGAVAAAGTKTPTANYRRNARSSATSRVSVGLPD